MSCNSNSNKASASSGKTAGLAAITATASNVGGAMLARAGQSLGPAQNAALRGMAFAAHLTGVAGPSASNGRKDLGAGAVKLGLKFAAHKLATKNPHVALALLAGQRAQALGDQLISHAASFTKTKETGTVMSEKRQLFFFKSKTPVTLWQSSLTGLINRRDSMGQPPASSEGVMFQTGRTTWHRGTVTAKTGSGKRTLTHLQSLSLPGAHYYFNRPISDEHAVGLATGQAKPEDVPGFVGQVSATEGLCTGWAEAKHALLKAYLYAGPKEAKP